MNVARVGTIRDLLVGRQVISCDGVVRKIVKIPDYQVKLDPCSPWHRRGGIETETACGRPIDGTQALRAYTLDDDMCNEGCFSPHELRLGVAHVAIADAKRFDTTDV